ncbi:T9SS type A sorting domain-containing protein, partial [archaeon]
FYVDGDGDTYGAGNQVAVCAVNATTAPAGYSVNNTDCNDNDGTKHATFSFYVDADGDTYGSLEVANNICAVNQNTAPSGYSVNNTDCDDTPVTGFSINPGVDEIYYNGIDDNCSGTIDEGRQITTQILANRCDTTLTKIYQSVNCEFRIALVTGYRFRITNQSNPSDVQTIDRPNAYFSFNQLARYDYATNYSIDVMVQRNGIWLGYYGTACTVRTPDVANLAVCGGTVATKGTFVYSEVLLYATGYRFEVTNVATQQVTPINNGRHYFTFNEIPGFTAGGVYSVKVSVKTTGNWSAYGSACLITAPGGVAPEIPTDKGAVATTAGFKVAAYPNPFANGFNLDIATSISDNVNVKVYDMLGKLIEVREVSATDLKEQELGNSYPAGVYNIIVTQGENLKTVRVIKR